VTYREVDLMIDEAKATSSQKQRVAIVVTHELAHQWFGNLVTMEVWILPPPRLVLSDCLVSGGATFG
jgi:aminopeptidase N